MLLGNPTMREAKGIGEMDPLSRGIWGETLVTPMRAL